MVSEARHGRMEVLQCQPTMAVYGGHGLGNLLGKNVFTASRAPSLLAVRFLNPGINLGVELSNIPQVNHLSVNALYTW